MSDNYDGPYMAQKIMRQQEQIVRLRKLLLVARYRLECIANGQQADQMILNPAEYARATLTMIAAHPTKEVTNEPSE